MTGDPSQDYVVRFSGPHISGDFDEPSGNDWIEIVYGTPLALPIPLGHWDHVWGGFELGLKPAKHEDKLSYGFQVSPEPIGALHMRPIRGGPASAWTGQWAEVRSRNPYISVKIAGDAAAYAVDVAETVFNVNEHDVGLTVVRAIAPPYTGDRWTHPGDMVAHHFPQLHGLEQAQQGLWQVQQGLGQVQHENVDSLEIG